MAADMYKVGDIVVVRADLNVGIYDSLAVVPDMKQFRGTSFKVSAIVSDRYYVTNENAYGWTDSMLSGLYEEDEFVKSEMSIEYLFGG